MTQEQKSDDARRREYILRFVLLGTLVLSGIALVINQADIISEGNSYRGVPQYIIPEIFLFFLALFVLARAGFHRVATFGLLGAYFLGATYSLITWGADLPVGLMVYALIVTISGVLLSPRLILMWAGFVAAVLGIVWHLQYGTGAISPRLYWKGEGSDLGDLIIITLLLVVMAVVSWLYSTEIRKSLQRAHTSETALKQERDNLESRIAERTRQLQEVQLEKMLHMYRFAEFGRLASGFLHDLVNPLNALSLNLEKLQTNGHHTDQPTTDNTKLIQRAAQATHRIEQFVQAAQKQVQQQSRTQAFSIYEELTQTVQILGYKAKALGVSIRIEGQPTHTLTNDPVKFSQMITNLISNAIDSYQQKQSLGAKEVLIQITEDQEQVTISVQDHGSGIPENHLQRIFEPLFTTKSSSNGTGLGLAITRDIAEKDFNGSIAVMSQHGIGSTFTLRLPTK